MNVDSEKYFDILNFFKGIFSVLEKIIFPSKILFLCLF